MQNPVPQDQDHPDVPGDEQGLGPEPHRSADIEEYHDDVEDVYANGDEEEDEAARWAAASASRPRYAWQARCRMIWYQSKGMILVLVAQMFGASMNVMTQILEIHSSMHPFQVLFARMSITAVACYFYMWWAKVPAPLGTREVLGLLLVRAACGFLGVFGLYYSVQYLELSEATVITFLVPILTCYACSLLIPGETFSRRQQLAGLISLVGVVLIARPFGKKRGSSRSLDESPDAADSYHRILATVVAFIGVLGAAGAYTSIRMIGRRAHPLVSVTYFSSVTTVISLVAMAVVPSVPFRLPTTATEWTLLCGLGVCGFLLQFLLTAGLSYVPPTVVAGRKLKTSGQTARATSMVYTQMLFALFYDKVVWGSTLSPISWAGSALILACAIYVAVVQDGRPREPREECAGADREGFKDDAADEEQPPVAAGEEHGAH